MQDDEVLRAAMEVRQGVIRLSRRMRMERPETGEPLLGLTVLAHLHRRGPMTPGELATAERVQRQSLTRILASLAEQGLVTRHEHPDDGRRALIAITAEGRLTLSRDLRQRDAWLADAMASHLTPEERGLLRLAAHLMDRLAEAPAASPAR